MKVEKEATDTASFPGLQLGETRSIYLHRFYKHHCTNLQAKPFGPPSTFPSVEWTDAARAPIVDAASLTRTRGLGSRAGKKIFFPEDWHPDPSSRIDIGSRITRGMSVLRDTFSPNSPA